MFIQGKKYLSMYNNQLEIGNPVGFYPALLTALSTSDNG